MSEFIYGAFIGFSLITGVYLLIEAIDFVDFMSTRKNKRRLRAKKLAMGY